MEQIEIQKIKRLTTINLAFLTTRNFAIQGIAIIGFFLLSVLLGTGDVGLFAVVAESVAILGYFSDFGLASALIQQKSEIEKEQLQTTFFIQESVVILLLIAVFFLYPHLPNSINFGSKEAWILISLCFAFVMASLKTIPSVLLERQLNYKLISTVDIIENTLFYVIAVIFAFLNFGAYSYAIATFVRSAVGFILIYYYRPWPVSIGFSLKTAKKLFRFGIPFQLNSFIAVAKDRLSNLLVAGIIGREAFGLLSWAQKGPRIPLSLMDVVIRVTFPTFSRLQDNPDFIRKSLEKTIFFISFFVFPLLAVMSLVAGDIVNLIPKYIKWLPALVPMYFYALNAAIAAITTPLTNAFNAIGKVTTTTKFMIMWTILTWIFYPVLSIKYGYIGTVIATIIVASSSFVVWYYANKQFQMNIVRQFIHPLIASILIIIFLLPISSLNLSPMISIVAKSLTAFVIYAVYNFYFSKKEIFWFIEQVKCLRK